MADYWKSQDRKYCDFCKCWIADNKPSVEFHEKGRRHQENVKKRLNQITRNSERQQKDNEKIDSQIKAMEAMAMAAYRKDVQNNADLTGLAINKKLEEDNLALKNGQTMWQELKSKDGHTYYWNKLTNDTKWDKPSEGFTSLEDQDKEQFNEASKQLREVEKMRQRQGLLKLQEQRKDEEEERARLAREKLKERAVQQIEPVNYAPIVEPGKTNPYGRWQKVETDSKPLDLDLPQQHEYFVPVVQEEEPEIVVREFKEKTVESLDVGGSTSFKKRKLGGGSRRNQRQRVDDD